MKNIYINQNPKNYFNYNLGSTLSFINENSNNKILIGLHRKNKSLLDLIKNEKTKKNFENKSSIILKPFSKNNSLKISKNNSIEEEKIKMNESLYHSYLYDYKYKTKINKTIILNIKKMFENKKKKFLKNKNNKSVIINEQNEQNRNLKLIHIDNKELKKNIKIENKDYKKIIEEKKLSKKTFDDEHEHESLLIPQIDDKGQISFTKDESSDCYIYNYNYNKISIVKGNYFNIKPFNINYKKIKKLPPFHKRNNALKNSKTTKILKSRSVNCIYFPEIVSNKCF